MRQRTTTTALIAALICSVSGCMDGPFYAMKQMNPYFRKQWQEDQQLGPTYTQRIEELELLESRLSSYAPEDQLRWSMQLEQLIQSDPSPEFRTRAVQAIATIQNDTVTRALNRASADDIEKVRMATAKSWAQQKTAPARDMLLSMATSDESNSVRAAAIRSLGNFEDPEVRQSLAGLIDDRSPAIQYEVAQSLAKLTGRNYGGDFASWKKFINGEDVPEPEPKTMTAQALDYVNPWR
jgi:HEAT repeats